MAIEKIIMVDDSLMMTLSKDIVEELGLTNGDDVHVSVDKDTLIVRLTDGTDRALRIRKATDKIFSEYDGVFETLAVEENENDVGTAQEFDQAADYVLKKNAELYKRLGK